MMKRLLMLIVGCAWGALAWGAPENVLSNNYAVWTNDLSSVYFECMNENSFVTTNLDKSVVVSGDWRTLVFTNTSAVAKTMRVSLDPIANDIARTGTVVQVCCGTNIVATITDLPTNEVQVVFEANTEYVFNCSASTDYLLGIGLKGSWVKYEANHGVFGEAQLTNLFLTVDSPYGYAPAIARSAFLFDGWYTRGGALVTSNSLVAADSPTTLYAHWDKAIVPYWVAFDRIDGVDETVMTNVYFNGGESRALASNRYTRIGYTFDGWRDNTNYVDYVDGQVVSNLLGITATNILGAIWKPITYNVAFDTNGGKGTMKGFAVEYDSTNNLPRCEFGCADYEFLGWATNAAGKVVYKDEHLITNNLVAVAGGTNRFYAVWKKLNRFTVYSVADSNDLGRVDFNAAKPVVFDGSILKSQMMSFTVVPKTNGTYRLSVDPITGLRKGTTVVVACVGTNGEWQTKASVSDMATNEVRVALEAGVTNRFTVTSSDDSDFLVGVGLTGKTVAFRTNGGEVSAADAAKGLSFNWSVGFVYGYMPTLTSDSTNGTFLGWFDDPCYRAGSCQYVATDLVTEAVDRLYAGWRGRTSVNMVYFVDSHSGIETNCFATKSVLSVLPELTSTREATFVGWSTNNAAGGYTDDIAMYATVPLTITNDWTFYSQWSTNFILEANDKGNWTVVRYNGEIPVDLSIPRTIGGGTVVAISSNVFANANVVSVTLPGSITEIATNAFAGCAYVTRVELPLISPLYAIFPASYSNLTAVTPAADVDSICAAALKGCVKVTSIEIPSIVTSVGDQAFYGCTKLSTVNFPTAWPDEKADRSDGFLEDENEITIGGSAFANCSSLMNVSLPLGVFTLPDRVFENCTSLTNDFEMPYTVTEIGEYAFSGCTALTRLTVTENVDTIGDYAFNECCNLKIVRYLGAQPSSVGENMYYHTRDDLVSGWNSRGDSDSWSSVEEKPWKTSRRTVAQWDASKMYSFCKVTFNYNNGNNKIEEKIYIKGRVLGSVISDPENGYGWWTRAIGGKRYGQYKKIEAAVRLYAHWSVEEGASDIDDDDDDEGEDEDGSDSESQSESKDSSTTDTTTGSYGIGWKSNFYSSDEEKGFAYSAANFEGYVLSGDDVMGTFVLKASAGKKVKNDDGAVVTNSKFKVTLTLLGGVKKTLSGVIDEDGLATATSGDNEFEATLSQFGIEGTFNEYELRGARNRYSAKSSEAKYAVRMARAAAVGTWQIALPTGSVDDLGGGAMAYGYSVLTATIANTGKGKITGVMADGTKVSVSSTLIVGDGCCCLPVVVPMYSGKKGGFAFAIWFTWNEEMGMESGDEGYSINGLSEWDASMNKKAAFTASFADPIINLADGGFSGAGVFAMDGTPDIEGVSIEDGLLPNDISITMNGTRWSVPKADKVKFDKESGYWEDQSDEPVNSAALKLSYTAKTGMFKGSFKVYAVTDAGKSKTYTANVNGLFINDEDSPKGYGTATIKNIGSWPVAISVGD